MANQLKPFQRCPKFSQLTLVTLVIFAQIFSACAPQKEIKTVLVPTETGPVPKDTQTSPTAPSTPTSPSAPAANPNTGVERTGGGGSTIHRMPRKTQVWWVVRDIKVRLIWALNHLLTFKFHLRETPLGDDSIEVRLRKANPSIIDVITETKIDIRYNDACEFNGQPVPASAHTNPNEVCFSIQSILDRIPSAESVEPAIVALAAHEYSHLVGFDEKDATALQTLVQDSVSVFPYNFASEALDELKYFLSRIVSEKRVFDAHDELQNGSVDLCKMSKRQIGIIRNILSPARSDWKYIETNMRKLMNSGYLPMPVERSAIAIAESGELALLQEDDIRHYFHSAYLTVEDFGLFSQLLTSELEKKSYFEPHDENGFKHHLHKSSLGVIFGMYINLFSLVSDLRENVVPILPCNYEDSFYGFGRFDLRSITTTVRCEEEGTGLIKTLKLRIKSDSSPTVGEWVDENDPTSRP